MAETTLKESNDNLQYFIYSNNLNNILSSFISVKTFKTVHLGNKLLLFLYTAILKKKKENDAHNSDYHILLWQKVVAQPC